MSLEQKAAERLQEILHDHGVLGVLFYFTENPTTVLGAANTALNRGALLVAYRLISNHGKVNGVLHALLGALADGAVLARVMVMDERCTVEPAARLAIGRNLDETIWRLQNAAAAAAKAARND
jgi:hypothetical protein